MFLYALLCAQQNPLALCRHGDARLGGELGVPVRKTVLAVFQRRDFEDFYALTFWVGTQGLGERGLKLFDSFLFSGREAKLVKIKPLAFGRAFAVLVHHLGKLD